MKNSFKKQIAALLLGISLGIGFAVPTSQAEAAGRAKITLKDGTVVEGEVVREAEGIVWLKIKSGGSEETRIITPAEMTKIDRISDGAAPETKPQPAPATKPDLPKNEPKPVEAATPAPAKAAEPEARKPHSGAPRAAVLTLGEGGDRDMVGVYVMAKTLHDAIPLLKQENVDIVVLRINSGGGYTYEVQKISDVIYDELRKNFRTVAWIDYAISAAAMSTHAVEEIYFAPEGAYGACTEWHGELIASEGRGLEERLFQMEKISTRGNHDPQIMRAMQIMEPLSASVSPRGDVKFYQDISSGDILLNPKGRVLTFNSQAAAKVRFSAGTAGTLDELGKAMQLPEVEWVGVKKPGFMWPICKAEQAQMDFREKTARDEAQFQEYLQILNAALQMGSSGDEETKAKLAGKAREMMNKIIAAVNNNPNMALFKFNIMPDKFRAEWIEPTEKKIKELTKKEKK